MKKKVFLVLVVLVTAACSLYIRKDLSTPYPNAVASVILEIPHGFRSRDIVRLLETKNVIQDQYATLLYIFYSGQRFKLQAGEYLFDHPMTPVEVIKRIVSGNVYLHKFTVPEGLTIDETAAKWEEQGFGAASDFVSAAQQETGRIQDLDPQAQSLEGYLFPETYFFRAHTTARQAVVAMVNRFKTVLARLDSDVPRKDWPLELHNAVILASLVESEAAHAEERTLVASVYWNRLKLKMLLQCDPTVIYALARADQYKGRLTLADLKYRSPFNTYVYPGLPPGPIMNPGYPSLRAAIQPAESQYLYFVRTTDGRHTFSENLAAHNRAVAAYRLLQRKQNRER